MIKDQARAQALKDECIEVLSLWLSRAKQLLATEHFRTASDLKVLCMFVDKVVLILHALETGKKPCKRSFQELLSDLADEEAAAAQAE